MILHMNNELSLTGHGSCLGHEEGETKQKVKHKEFNILFIADDHQPMVPCLLLILPKMF